MQPPIVVNGQELVAFNQQKGALQGQSEEEPSVIHRLLATTIVQMFIFVQFILPYVQILAASVYRYERKHRMCERVISSSMNTVDGLGRRGAEVTSAIYAMNDGKVGQALNAMAIWWIRGLAGGIHEGVGEGMAILGVDSSRRRPSQREKGVAGSR
ncbi:hypothetical protein K402DRAFT_398549 [Aulographum hederae CBS 113979]|uniref:Uncharacterized protein n=1 Tax=Aulographum hederae CBS 113979 TaxID=1176131 RepID=A0A6G1GKL7_9PEZI|nr:hypothetical protein K402DRAFT_398549 [Aulographum hederae CBS 113979]